VATGALTFTAHDKGLIQNIQIGSEEPLNGKHEGRKKA
jgi:hypothetical protein